MLQLQVHANHATTSQKPWPGAVLISRSSRARGKPVFCVLRRNVPWAVRTVADCNSHITQIAQRFGIKSGVWGLEHPRHNQLRHNQRHKLSCQMIYSLGFLAGIQSNGGGPVGDCKIWMPKTFKNLSMQHRRDARSLQTSLHKGRNKRCLVVTCTLRHSPISYGVVPPPPAQHWGAKINVLCLRLIGPFQETRLHTPQSKCWTHVDVIPTLTTSPDAVWLESRQRMTWGFWRMNYSSEKEKDIEWLDQLGDCTPKCDEEQIPAHADFLHS